MTATPLILHVQEEDGGRRLDLFLAEALHLSRAQARRLLARGAVRVDGRSVSAGAKGVRVARGATVEVAPFVRPEYERAVAESSAPLAVLARGPGWLAVDKPPGAPVHPLAPEETGTVLNALIARHPEIQGVGEGGLRSGVVHRLDVDTSGVLLFAIREATWRHLRAGFREHRVAKFYRAIVLGRLERPGAAEVGLVAARRRPARVRVVGERERSRGVRVGVLSWCPLEVFERATLLEVRPKTGFLHQIRATFAHLGFPIAGDRAYGAASDPTGAHRQMLHAKRLAFGEVVAESPDPPDFTAGCAQLRS